MAEESTIVNGEPGAHAAPQGSDRTFTQADVDRIVKERLARAKSEPPADYDELKRKAKAYDEAQEAAKSELERANDRAAKAEKALADAKAEMEHAALVSKVSAETGVPASLLHGGTEEELAASAKAVSEFAESRMPQYPHDRGGSPAGGGQVTVESIESIKSPLERVRMRAANAGLYQ